MFCFAHLSGLLAPILAGSPSIVTLSTNRDLLVVIISALHCCLSTESIVVFLSHAGCF
jgi:hypothetical protein